MEDKKQESNKDQHKDKAEKKKKLDKELNQTFPASDPPSRTRPGHEKEKTEDNE